MSPQLTEPQASPYTYNGLVLYLSDDSTTGYAGVTRMASAPRHGTPVRCGIREQLVAGERHLGLVRHRS